MRPEGKGNALSGHHPLDLFPQVFTPQTLLNCLSGPQRTHFQEFKGRERERVFVPEWWGMGTARMCLDQKNPPSCDGFPRCPPVCTTYIYIYRRFNSELQPESK